MRAAPLEQEGSHCAHCGNWFSREGKPAITKYCTTQCREFAQTKRRGGRPGARPRIAEADRATVKVLLPKSLRSKMQGAADRAGMSLTAWLRELIGDTLALDE